MQFPLADIVDAVIVHWLTVGQSIMGYDAVKYTCIGTGYKEFFRGRLFQMSRRVICNITYFLA